MEGVTLALAILGVVLAVASLAWQAWSWQHSGPVVKVRGTSSFLTTSSELWLHVEATNTGRAPCTVEAWGVLVPPDGQIVQPNPWPISAPLPYRLESHASASWFMHQSELHQVSQQRGVPLSAMRPFVRIAGKGTISGPSLTVK